MFVSFPEGCTVFHTGKRVIRVGNDGMAEVDVTEWDLMRSANLGFKSVAGTPPSRVKMADKKVPEAPKAPEAPKTTEAQESQPAAPEAPVAPVAGKAGK